MENHDVPQIGQSIARRSPVVLMAAQSIRRLSASIGNIEPMVRQCLWAELTDASGMSIGRVSVHITPNGRATKVDMLFHAVSLGVVNNLPPLVLRDRKGQEFIGKRSVSIPPRWTCTVPKDGTLTLQIAGTQPVASRTVADHVRSLTAEYLEQMQEQLERHDRR